MREEKWHYRRVDRELTHDPGRRLRALVYITVEDTFDQRT